jgi:hypothetical protein
MLLVGALSLALSGSACSADTPAPQPTSTVRPVGPTATVPAPGTVSLAVVTKMDDTSVSWTEARMVSSETGSRSIQALPGAEHEHSAPLSAGVVLLAATGCGAKTVQVDDMGLGTATCTAAQFREQVVGKANAAPAITFNEGGQIVRMAARHLP